MTGSWKLGANYLGASRCAFLVWAPKAKSIELRFTTPPERVVPLEHHGDGYYQTLVTDIEPGARYFYRINGVDRPDPASRWQPEGVHGPSAVVDPAFAWTDQHWPGLPLRDYILYELHVGTFTSEGTFEAVIPHLGYLKELGVTALEIMPVAQFPGNRNWGYDGVYPFAVQHSYGGPQGLKKLVDACHQTGLAVVLDVVYNHLGPEGNYLPEFGHYFNNCYRTPWGAALNFDATHNDEVRRYFLENALQWQTDFHFDALRLDAVHAIRDFSADPFLAELARTTRQRAEELNRRFYLIAESDLNNARVIQPEILGGYGLAAQWSDDFHHCVHVLLTGEQEGYYEDFGGVRQLAKVWREGYAYSGEFSRYRKHRHGNQPRHTSARQFVVYSQNHDQIGNRFRGDRLTGQLDLDGLKLAAATVLLSPFVPLLFMGEEYAEPRPFQYIISHTDPALVEAVRNGRREEFASFAWESEVPDPCAESTFQNCILDRQLAHRKGTKHHMLFAYYRELIHLRKSMPALKAAEKGTYEVQAREQEKALLVHYENGADAVLCLFTFGAEPVPVPFDLPPGEWRKIFDSSEERWNGKEQTSPGKLSIPGQPALQFTGRSVAVYQKTQGESKRK